MTVPNINEADNETPILNCTYISYKSQAFFLVLGPFQLLKLLKGLLLCPSEMVGKVHFALVFFYRSCFL